MRTRLTLCSLAVLLLAATGGALAAPGDLDTTFAGGITQVDLASAQDKPEALIAATDGSLFLAGATQVESVRELLVAKFTASGALDPGFGGDGIVHTPIGDDAVAYAVAVQGDGKVVAVGKTGTFDDADIVVVRYTADGDPDPMFGGGDGIVTFDLGGKADEAHAVLVEPGGAIVVVGFGLDAMFKEQMVILRFDATGAPDMTFGGDGVVTADFTNGARAYAVVRRPSDGAIVVGGRTTFFDDFAVAVFDSGGVPDADFSTDGFATTNFGNNDGIVSLLLQDDEKILAIGESRSNGNDGILAMARYKADGDLDASFNFGGTKTSNVGSNMVIAGGSIVSADRYLVLFESSGQVLVSAFHLSGDQDGSFASGLAHFDLHDVPAAVVRSGTNGGCVVATELLSGGGGDLGLFRLHGDGTLDRAFGQHGRLVFSFRPSGFDDASAVLVQPDGRIVVAGTDDGLRSLFGRFDADGQLDRTFLSGDGIVSLPGCATAQSFGIVRLPSDGYVVAGFCNDLLVVEQFLENGDSDMAFGPGAHGFFSTDFGGAGGVAHALVRQSDGKLVIVGRRGVGDSADFVVVRLTEGGLPDGDFGTSGVATIDFAGRADDAWGVVVQPDDRIVVSGYTRLVDVNDFAVARLLANGMPDPDFGTAGKSQIDFGGADDRGFGMLRQTNGRLVIAGQAGTLPSISFALLGLDAAGMPDGTFGTGGKVTSNFTGDDFGTTVVELPDGRLLVGGTMDDANDVPGFGLARYSATGVLEEGFGTGGAVQTPFFGAEARLSALALTPEGDAVATGALKFSNSGSTFVMARYVLGGDGPPTTTTTTLPGNEICGNCVDDDGDGLTDFEDPSCCGDGGPTLSLRRGLVKPVKTQSRLALSAALTATTPDASVTGLTVQLRPADGGELLCARIAGAKFRRKGKAARFADKKGTLAGAGGLAKILLKTKKDGSVALALAAKRATFATPAAGPLTITFGFGDGSTAGECAATTATFRAKKRGVIVAP